MTFLWPIMLLWLLLIPAFVVLYVRMQQRRRLLAARFGNSGSAQDGTRKLGVRRHVPAAFFLTALAILIVALARPEGVVGLPRVEGTVILAFDVSGSMAADDMEPTRLEAARTAAKEFVLNQPSSVQIGIVTFSEGGFTTQPPTDEQAAILSAIDRLAVQSGTSVARGIEAALNVIYAVKNPTLSLSERNPAEAEAPTPTPVPQGTYTSAVIVLLTDGENNQDPDPLEVAQLAADRGIRIHTVGLGSTEGAVLNLEGYNVRSRLDEESLKQISQLTGGTYYNAQSAEDLRQVYDNLDPELVIKPQKIEVTSLFAGAGILVLMLGSVLSLLWLGRLP